MMVTKLKDRAAALFASVCFAVAFVSPVMAQSPTAEKKPGETDQAKLQGKWQLASITMQGKVIKKNDKLAEWKDAFDKELLIEGNRLIHVPGVSEGTFKLDDTRDPKLITFQDKDGKLTFRGIYTLDGDTFTVCINGDGTDVRRPEEFVTKEGTPLLLIVLKKSPAAK